MEHQPKTITIDGQAYEVEQFSEGIQQAIYIYNTFNAQLQGQQLEVMKTQAALQTVGQQITDAVKAELVKSQASDEKDDVVADPIEQTA